MEVAPAVGLPKEIREGLANAALLLAKTAGYRNAGTVEFLVDIDSNEFFFIEVNPRIQVEHTVTETVTGIDLVRAQILIAQGCRLDEAPLALPNATSRSTASPCNAASTTEDPRANFAPDYGRINTYRSPGGFGIRLDGGSGYGGAIITPFYDSLLVKVTATGTDFPASLPSHGARPARVPHSRRKDEHPVPRKRRQPSGIPSGRNHNIVPRYQPRSLSPTPHAVTAPQSCSLTSAR